MDNDEYELHHCEKCGAAVDGHLRSIGNLIRLCDVCYRREVDRINTERKRTDNTVRSFTLGRSGGAWTVRLP